MTCVQTQCVTVQPSAMAGFEPQKLPRTKAAARYICFFIHACFAAVCKIRKSCCSGSMFSFCHNATSNIPRNPMELHITSFPTFPRLDPERFLLSCASHVILLRPDQVTQSLCFPGHPVSKFQATFLCGIGKYHPSDHSLPPCTKIDACFWKYRCPMRTIPRGDQSKDCFEGTSVPRTL